MHTTDNILQSIAKCFARRRFDSRKAIKSIDLQFIRNAFDTHGETEFTIDCTLLKEEAEPAGKTVTAASVTLSNTNL